MTFISGIVVGALLTILVQKSGLWNKAKKEVEKL
jgi:F0F1-type ATP synthase assembly protein I